MKHLVIGAGEIGSAIYNILKDEYTVDVIDKDQSLDKLYDVLHICFPQAKRRKDFIKTVQAYRSQYLTCNGLIIIHSTVAVGTTIKCGLECVHSPVRGIHPYLDTSLRTFVKYFGGSRAGEAAEIFQKVGIPIKTTFNAKETEAMKLWSTTAYGMSIMLEKQIHEYCEQHNLDFDIVYEDATVTYNEGYKRLGMSHVQRPVLEHIPGKIGGHCVIPNTQLLGTRMAKWLHKLNRRIKQGS